MDAIYYCPHHPEGNQADFAISCACRKPSPGLLEAAARTPALAFVPTFDDFIAAERGLVARLAFGNALVHAVDHDDRAVDGDARQAEQADHGERVSPA